MTAGIPYANGPLHLVILRAHNCPLTYTPAGWACSSDERRCTFAVPMTMAAPAS